MLKLAEQQQSQRTVTWTKEKQAAGSKPRTSSDSASASSAMSCALRCELFHKLQDVVCLSTLHALSELNSASLRSIRKSLFASGPLHSHCPV